jgi:hypothetical protein
MRACACLHANLRSRRYTAVELLQPPPSTQALPPHRLLMPIHAVQLKHVLCQVHTDSNNLHLGFLLIPDWCKNDITSLALDAD